MKISDHIILLFKIIFFYYFFLQNFARYYVWYFSLSNNIAQDKHSTTCTTSEYTLSIISVFSSLLCGRGDLWLQISFKNIGQKSIRKINLKFLGHIIFKQNQILKRRGGLHAIYVQSLCKLMAEHRHKGIVRDQAWLKTTK